MTSSAVPGDRQASVAAEKRNLRHRLLRRRASVGELTLQSASRAIRDQVREYLASDGDLTIGLYLDAGRGEVRTSPLIAALGGHQLAAPRVAGRGRALEFRLVQRLDELVPGPFGLLEPSRQSEVVPLDAIDVMLVPGLAFDTTGARLGYGMGYYDRTLSQTDAVRIGLALELQLVAMVPIEAHDERMDLIISERRMIRCAERDACRVAPDSGAAARG